VGVGLAVGPPAWATISVNCNKGGDLQSKLNSAASGSTILISGTCHGNFSIFGKTLTLKGNPTGTLDGQDAGNTLGDISGGFSLHLVQLTVTGGGSTGAGAGIF